MPKIPRFQSISGTVISWSNQLILHVAMCVPLASVWVVPSGSVNSQRVPTGTHTVAVKVLFAVSHCTLASP